MCGMWLDDGMTTNAASKIPTISYEKYLYIIRAIGGNGYTRKQWDTMGETHRRLIAVSFSRNHADLFYGELPDGVE